MIRPLANLYEQLRRLPGIGSKTAMRLAYHVIDMPAEDVKQLAAALSGAKEQIHYCSRCFNLTDSVIGPKAPSGVKIALSSILITPVLSTSCACFPAL